VVGEAAKSALEVLVDVFLLLLSTILYRNEYEYGKAELMGMNLNQIEGFAVDVLSEAEDVLEVGVGEVALAHLRVHNFLRHDLNNLLKT
jgi:hypothetical protein